MDALDLEFADGTFDLTYSHSIVEWLSDPLRGLKEQRRVTKPGGWVVAGAGIYEDWTLFPRCTVFDKLNRAKIAQSRSIGDIGAVGSELFKLFAELELQDMTVLGYVAPIDCAHQGSRYFDYNYGKLKLFVSSGTKTKRTIDAGLASSEELETARKEIENWYAHPHLRPEVLVAGRVT